MVKESEKVRFGRDSLVRGLADYPLTEPDGDVCDLRVELGQRTGTRFLSPVSGIVKAPARIHERLATCV